MFNGAYLPEDTVYESRFDGDGKLVSAGETYLVLNAVRIIGRQTDLLPEFIKFSSDNIGGLIKQLSEALIVKDENGRELSTYFVQSNLLRSVISAALINSASEYVYIPTFARETNADGEHVCYIEKTELTVLLNSFSELSKLIMPVIDGGDAMDAFIEFTHGELFNKLLEESTIFEGTVGKLLVEYFGNDETVIIPVALKEQLDGWASERGRQGEIKNLLNAFKVIGLELDELADHGLDTDKVIDNVLALSAERLDEALKSSVMHYTLSNQLIKGIDLGSFSLIVPHAARQELTDDSISGLVKKSEIQCILRIANELEFTEETEISQVLTKLVANKSALAESYILSASMAYSLVNEQSIREYITIPQVYEVAASKEKLENLNSSNPWKTEIVRFIDALDDIMGISASDNFSFDDMSDNMSQFLKDMNSPSAVNGNVSRLTLCYASQIIAGSITGELDDILEGKVDAALLSGAKSANGNYTERELSALSGALNICDIDVMKIDAAALTEKLKGQLLELNEPAEGYEGKSTLEVIYP
ncbi:MAG: hypothetical protein K2L72_01320, partial [Clostridia bacterium]|nr:hypothetical protein [Clostridia bacterium]